MTGQGKKLGFHAFLGTQFLGAFNDNVSKMLVICYGTAVLGAETREASTFLALAAACFILPFLLFSHLAGYLADRFAKSTVMVWTKVAEIVIMALGFWMAWRGSLHGLIAVLFCMGAQSAFFSPAKYGFLPEILPTEGLPRANGAMQLWTFLAINLGGWIGGAISSLWGKPGELQKGFLVCVGIAFLGTLASFAITRTRAIVPDAHFALRDPITPHAKTFREIARDRVLLTAFLGNSFFWFLGTIMQLTIVLLAKDTLQKGDQMVGALQATLGFGIGLGCALAGFLGRRGIPYHFTRPGGIAMGIMLILGGLLGHLLPCAILFIALGGFCGGFYHLPLATATQERSPEDKRGQYLGAGNAMDCIAMLLGSGFLWILRAIHASPTAILGIMGALAIAVAIPLGKHLPKNS